MRLRVVKSKASSQGERSHAECEGNAKGAAEAGTCSPPVQLPPHPFQDYPCLSGYASANAAVPAANPSAGFCGSGDSIRLPTHAKRAIRRNINMLSIS